MKLVFDFGGVLFRWRPLVVIQQCLPTRAVDQDSAAHWADQVFQSYGGDWGEFDRGTVTVPELVERIAQRTGLQAAEVQAVVDAVPLELQAKPDSVALLRRLRDAGRPLYYLSNMPEPYALHLEAANDFLAWFSDGVFSARVHANKPEPAIFGIASERFGAKPQELLLLDDHGPNVTAARAAGWQALHFTDAAATQMQLQQLGIM